MPARNSSNLVCVTPSLIIARKSRGAEVVDELPAEVHRVLVSEGRAISFLSVPDETQTSDDTVPEPTETPLDQPGQNEIETNFVRRHQDDQLQTSYTSTNLQKRLLNTFYTARTYIEEQGVNVLYLTLGMLCWYETTDSTTVRRAPLILIPVEIYRSSVQSRFRIRYTEDDIGDNLSLRAKLKIEYGIELPELTNGDELDVSAYFAQVETAIQPQDRWTVDPTTITLGFYSFATFLMYNDLDVTNWPVPSNPVSHPMLQSLLAHGFNEPPPEHREDVHIDTIVAPQDNHQVVDADSSQTLAILDVKRGRNLVIQGPPGTGKSQTITNLIAEALAEDKSVLFVAEKMAALEVVKRRLDRVGLGDACLELHSHKTNKKAFLNELQRTLELEQANTKDYSADLELLRNNRDQLNAYSEAVNMPVGYSGITPYQAYGELLQLGQAMGDLERPKWESQAILTWSAIQYRQELERVEELQTVLGQIGVPVQHPFWGCRRQQYLPAERQSLTDACHQATTAIHSLQQTGNRQAHHLLRGVPLNRAAIVQLLHIAQIVLSVPSVAGIRVVTQEWQTRSQEITTLLQNWQTIANLRKQYDAVVLPEAWQADMLEIRQAYVSYGRKWWAFLAPSYRQARNKLAALCRTELPTGFAAQLQLIDAILEVKRHQPALTQSERLMSYLFGSQWQGLASDWTHLRQAAEWLIQLYTQINAQTLPRTVLDYLGRSPDLAALKSISAELLKAARAHEKAMAWVIQQFQLDEARRFPDGVSLIDQPFTEQAQFLQYWQHHLDQLQEIVSYNQRAEALASAGLEGLLKVATTWPEAAKHLVTLFKEKYYQELIAWAFQNKPALALFNGRAHSYRIQKFSEADTLLFQVNQKKLALKHRRSLPQYQAGGQLGVLQREFAKKRRHLPIRKLMSQAGHAVQIIKPVFMMSPLSIAMFIPPDALHFDLVVFDEASQVRPVEAFGAVLRGKQVVVVGDSRQLPPTNFFDQIVEADEEEESPTADLESILSLFTAQGAPQRMLRWHYRSRHESLIAVSNYEFYDNKLVVFPSPEMKHSGIGLVYHYLPDTAYDRGRSRSNPKEAQRVAEAVMRHAKTDPEQTLGVAAFSISQMQAIIDQLELLRRQDTSCEAFFNSHPEEPFFIKNLENVQGDERDVIFISIGYGRSADGYIAMNFGPLNRDGGERRLNVLITRARYRCELFTNLTADDIDLNRTEARGVVALKRYLQYAQKGVFDIPRPSGREADSPFEEAVADALRQKSYEVVHQVGSAGFFIDLAVVDKALPGRYLLGIECDGATYHSARSARDRDRLRQQVLEGLGWRIHRIWSTDWYRNPNQELNRLLKAIEAAKTEPTTFTKALPVPQPIIPAQKKVVPVERHEAVTMPAPAEVQNYVLAKPVLRLRGRELHELRERELSEIIQQIVEVESPVHVDVVARRIVEAAGVKRIGNRIKTSVDRAITFAMVTKMMKKRGDFLWQKGMVKASVVRSHAHVPEFSRTIDQIAPEEITLAIEIVVAKAFGMERESIPPAVSSLFGFGRTSEDMYKHIDKIVWRMMARQQLVKKGDFLFLDKGN